MHVRYPDRAVLAIVEVAHHGVLPGGTRGDLYQKYVTIFCHQIWGVVAKSSSNPDSYLVTDQSRLSDEPSHASRAIRCGFLCSRDEHSFGEHRDRRAPLPPPQCAVRDAEPRTAGHGAAPG